MSASPNVQDDWFKWVIIILMFRMAIMTGIPAEICGFIKVSTHAIRISNEAYMMDYMKGYMQQKSMHMVKN